MNAAGEDAPPQEFAMALASISKQRVRPEVSIDRAPSPTRIAPFTAAWTGEVADEDGVDSSGRLVLLYDPAGQRSWQGRFRIVVLIHAALEPEMAADDVLPEVAWTWLADALGATHAEADALGGTVTRTMSRSFGALGDRDEECELEIRASWSPRDGDLGPQIAAWATLLCMAAGLPLLPEGVRALPPRRGTGPID